jgi:hypothetical protein
MTAVNVAPPSALRKRPVLVPARRTPPFGGIARRFT